MNKNKILQAILLAFSFLIFISLSGCKRHERVRSPTEKHYEMKGKVVAVDRDQHNVTVAHEDIKDYMSAMTMPFTVRDEWVYEVLAPGDQISATLIVDGAQSWLEDIVITHESTDSTSSKGGEGAVEAKPGDEVPDYGLINQDSKRIRLKEYRGKGLLITFIYTRCPLPDYCPLMSTNFAEIDKELQKQPELYNKTHLLSISIDPDYDTPKVLRSYGAAYTGRYSDETFAHWEFASGSKDEVKGVAQFFGLRYYEGADQIIHGLRTIIVGPDGKVFKVYRGNEWKPAEVLKDMQTLLTPK